MSLRQDISLRSTVERRKPRRNRSELEKVQETRNKSRSNRRTVGSFELLERRELLAAISWDGGGGDLLWSNPLNWINNQLPGAADDVTINATGNVTVLHEDGATLVKSLTLSDSLTVSGGAL